MKKRALALMLSAVMLVCMLAGCGSSGNSDTDASDDAATADASADETDTSDVTYEEMNITVSCSTNESETPSLVLQKFMEEVTEATGGAVTFTVYYGSTFCSSTEELYQMQSGALDMCILQTLAYGDVIPLFVSIPQMYIGTDEEAKAYFDEMFLEGESGELIEASLSEYNTKMIGNIYTGLNCWFSTQTFESFEDLEGLKIGCQDSAPIDGLGLTAVFVDVSDYYDSLERGVIDAGTFSFDGTVSLKLYEPASNVMLDQGKTWGMPFCMREDLWDSMSEELQTVFEEAMAVAQDYSVDTVNEVIASAQEELEAEGVTIGTLSDEDAEASFLAQTEASIANGMERAEAADCVDDMITILTKSLELYGLDPDEYLADYQ